MIPSVFQIQNHIQEHYSHLGINKRQQVVRLLFEISKREKCDFQAILNDIKGVSRFPDLKHYLLKRRFPNLNNEERQNHYPLTNLEIDPREQVHINCSLKIQPQRFFIEESTLNTNLVKRIQIKFPSADFHFIPSYKEFTGEKQFGILEYNQRLVNFFIIKENFDFYKRCPCSCKSVSCGYYVINLGSGCAFECTYCYLQDYINSPGIVIPANIEDFFEQFEYYQHNIRLGSGELTDSLAFDHITEFSPVIVEFFKRYPKSSFEFKTKSNNIDLLLTIQPADNIIISWSINPQNIIESTEFYTASLQERLEAAGRCVKAGYRVAFHFDPLIYYPSWEEDYFCLVEDIFNQIDPAQIAWMSLGTLRLTPGLKKIIESRFPENKILDEEFIYGYDGKLRYPEEIRKKIYIKMLSWIKQFKSDLYVYLCMEEKSMCLKCEAFPLKKEQRLSHVV